MTISPLSDGMTHRSPKIIRATTVAGSMDFCRELLRELRAGDGYEVVALSSPGPELDETGQREGVRTIAVPMRRRMSPLSDLRSLCRLIRVFRRERPDMVHSMTPKAGLLCMMAAWLCRVPVRVHTFTGLVFPTATGLSRRILMLTDRLTCACATHVVPEGEGVKSDLTRFGITRKPLRVLGYGNIKGVDLDRFDPALFPAPAPDAPFTFVFVGRLVGDKGINELVEAFTTLHRGLPATRLVLVGAEEPDLDPLLPATRAAIAACPGIEAVGRQADVRPYLAAAHALVFPSYREGFPNVVLEAGAMGLPAIVTDINGSREIITDGHNGTIIPPRSAAALLDAMRRLATDRAATAAMASIARQSIASRFAAPFVRSCLRTFYRQILPPV